MGGGGGAVNASIGSKQISVQVFAKKAAEVNRMLEKPELWFILVLILLTALSEALTIYWLKLEI